MAIGVTWWLTILAGTGVAVVLARRWPREAAGVAVATFALLVVAVAGSARPADTRGTVIRPFVAAADAEPQRVAEREAAAPASRRTGTRRPSLATVVRRYYAALDRGAYRAAWGRLSPAVRAAFGGFAAWRAGYGTTLGHRVTAVEAHGEAVALVLVARDRTACGGTVTRRFRVRWRFAGRRAAAVTATALGGRDPAATC